MKYLVLALVLTALTALHARDAEACSCAPPPDAVTSLGKAAAVFAGQAMTVTPDADGFVIEFEASVRFKAAENDPVVIHTARDSAGCGYNFKQGAHYLVYAYDQDGALWVNLCGRTAPIANAADDVAKIRASLGGDSGEPTAPAEPPATDQVDPGATDAGSTGDEPAPPPQTVQRKGCGCNGGADAGGGVLLLAALALIARRRSSSSAR